jgi:hypothetical protein
MPAFASSPMTPEQRAEARRILESLNLGPVRPYSTYDFGRARDEHCLSVVGDAGDVGLYAFENADVTPTGLILFAGTDSWLGDEEHPGQAELVAGPGTSQLDKLRLARTDGANYGLSTEDIIAQLREYDAAYGITIFSATTDTVRFSVNAKPRNIKTFARSLYKLCPDIVDQGAGTVEALADGIAEHLMVTLWWD